MFESSNKVTTSFLGIPPATLAHQLDQKALTLEASIMDDEVIREVDVFVSDNLPLFLLQFPLKPVYADSIDITSGKFKPQHKKLELEVPLVLPENYPRDNANATIPKSQKYQSSIVAQDSCMGAAIIKDNAMYITPIQSVLQLRPSFKNMSSFKGEMIEQMEDDTPEAEVNETEGGALQQVTLKRKESEKAQSTRVQSFAYLQAKEELEPWRELTINPIGSVESESKFGEMGGSTYYE